MRIHQLTFIAAAAFSLVAALPADIESADAYDLDMPMTALLDEPTHVDLYARSFNDDLEEIDETDDLFDLSDLAEALDEDEDDTLSSRDLEARGPSKAIINNWLKAHNTERKKRGARALTWNATLSNAAQKWVNKCSWKHSGGAVGHFGENLFAAAPPQNYGPFKATASWNAERSKSYLWSRRQIVTNASVAEDYNPKNPNYSHWTQVVWKGTRQIGCAAKACSKMNPDPFPGWVRFTSPSWSRQ